MESRGQAELGDLLVGGRRVRRRASPRPAGPCRPRTTAGARACRPTTASSTSAVSRCGVDTATSTPHISLNIHSFFGLFTRATTRGTPNSCLASSEIDEVVLVVAGDGGHHVGLVDARPRPARRPRRRRPATTARPRGSSVGQRPRAPRSASFSTISTSWPPLCELLGDERADAAAAGDDDPHQCPPALTGPARRSSNDVDARRRPPRRYTTSPS